MWCDDTLRDSNNDEIRTALVVAEIKRYEQAIGCQYMVLMLRHPTGPSHQETMRCIELLGREVLPKCR